MTTSSTSGSTSTITPDTLNGSLGRGTEIRGITIIPQSTTVLQMTGKTTSGTTRIQAFRMDDCEDLILKYLKFVKGTVDLCQDNKDERDGLLVLVISSSTLY